MNQFEVLRANSVVTFHGVFCRILIIMIVGRFTPVGRSLAFVFQYRFQRCSLNIRRYFYTGKVKEGGGEVYVHADGAAGASGFNGLRITDDKRHTLTFFVHESFVEPAMFTQKEALVGGIDNNGIVQFAGLFEVIQQATDILVYSQNGSQIIAHILLVFPAD